MAEQGAQAAQRDGIDALLSAREKQRLDIGAMHEMMLAKFNELPKGGGCVSCGGGSVARALIYPELSIPFLLSSDDGSTPATLSL